MVVLSHWNSHAQEKPSDDSRSRDDKADLSAGQSTEPSQAALSSTSPRNRLNGQDPSSAASSPQAEPPHCKSPAPRKHEVGSKLYSYTTALAAAPWKQILTHSAQRQQHRAWFVTWAGCSAQPGSCNHRGQTWVLCWHLHGVKRYTWLLLSLRNQSETEECIQTLRLAERGWMKDWKKLLLQAGEWHHSPVNPAALTATEPE